MKTYTGGGSGPRSMESGQDGGIGEDDPVIVEAIIRGAQAGALRVMARDVTGMEQARLVLAARQSRDAATNLLTEWARAVAAAGPSDFLDEE